MHHTCTILHHTCTIQCMVHVWCIFGAYIIVSNILKMLSCAPIVRNFLFSCSFLKIARHNLGIGRFYVLLQYVQVVLCCTVHRVIIRVWFLFFLVDLFVSHHSFSFIKTKHKQSMARWHDTVRLDCTNRPYMPVKQARTVRATAAATAATTITKYNINLTLLLLFFALCCSFFN